jgi:hypothetical protein
MNATPAADCRESPGTRANSVGCATWRCSPRAVREHSGESSGWNGSVCRQQAVVGGARFAS